MPEANPQQKWLVIGLGTSIVLYSVFAIGFVATSPDLRLRCLLSDDELSAAGYQGVVIHETSGIVCKGQPPEVGDVLLSIGEHKVRTFLDFTLALRELRSTPIPAGGILEPGSDPSEFGNLLPSLVEVGEGERLVEVKFWRKGWEKPQTGSYLLIQSLPVGEVILSLTWFLLQLGIFAVSALAVWHRPYDRPARVFFGMCVTTLGAYIGGYHWWVIAGNPWLNLPFVVCATLVPIVTLHFFLIYPRPKEFFSRNPLAVLGGLYGVPVLTAFAAVVVLTYCYWIHRQTPSEAGVATVARLLSIVRIGIYAYLAFVAVCFVGMIAALAHGFFATRNPIERSQMKSLFWAGLVAVLPVGYSLGLAFFDRVEFALGNRVRILMFLASLAFMLAYAVAIVRFKLMLVDQMISKGMLYYVASCGLTIVYGGAVSVSSLMAHAPKKTTISSQQLLVVALILVVIVVLLLWLRDRFQQMIDRRFYREKYQLDKALQGMNRAVGHFVDRQALAQKMLDSCRDVLRVDNAALYLQDSGRGKFQLIASEGGIDIPLQLTLDEAFSETLRRESTLDRHSPAVRNGEPTIAATLKTLRAELIHELELDAETTALVVLGAKRNAGSFTAEDLTFLHALGQITSVALHSAKVHQDIARLNEDLRLKVDKIAEQKYQIAMMQAELTGPQSQTPALEPVKFRRDSIKGNSPAIRKVLATVRKVAVSESSVLIRGESGTGKELLAQALHENSRRHNGPIVRVHCAALSSSLLESELFGHVKGAFTGAQQDRVGRFESANGGTLFLDEIGDISIETQIKLLRVLQERSFEPVGGTRTIHVDVRLITATHQDLEQLIAQGRFREDLYYRLNVISITLPSLKERTEDIFELAFHFLQKASKRLGKRLTHIEGDAIDALKHYPWPGNIRELENIIERAVVLADEDKLTVNDLPPEILNPREPTVQPRRQPEHVLETKPAPREKTKPTPAEHDNTENEQSAERAALQDALRECDGNKAQAARQMGMPRSTYYSKLKKYRIE